jgi:uncharacterized protein YuzE
MLARAKAVSFDPEADAAYVVFSALAVVRTDEVEDGVLVDFDENGNPVGVEILAVRSRAGTNDPGSWAAGVAEGLLSRRAVAA